MHDGGDVDDKWRVRRWGATHALEEGGFEEVDREVGEEKRVSIVRDNIKAEITRCPDARIFCALLILE